MNRRQAQVGGKLAERDGAAAAVRVAPHLGGGELGVPEGDEAEGQEPSPAFPVPFIDHPVVVGPDTGPGEAAVLGLVERLAAEAGECGEAQ